MKIELLSASAVSNEEVMLTFAISSPDGKREKRKLLLFAEQYVSLGLSKGEIMDEKTFDCIEEMSKKCRALRKGSDLLSYSASSKVRLAQRLRNKGVDRENAQEAAAQLERLGLINEEADVERAIQIYLKKLYGKNRIYKELCAKGYEREIIVSELSLVDDEVFAENCIALVRKKYKNLPKDPAEQKKTVASLVRYGYTLAQIKNAINKN